MFARGRDGTSIISGLLCVSPSSFGAGLAGPCRACRRTGPLSKRPVGLGFKSPVDFSQLAKLFPPHGTQFSATPRAGPYNSLGANALRRPRAAGRQFRVIQSPLSRARSTDEVEHPAHPDAQAGTSAARPPCVGKRRCGGGWGVEGRLYRATRPGRAGALGATDPEENNEVAPRGGAGGAAGGGHEDGYG